MFSPNDDLTRFDSIHVSSHGLRFELRVEVQTPTQWILWTYRWGSSVNALARWWFNLFRLDMCLIKLLKVQIEGRGTYTSPNEYFGLTTKHWASMDSPHDDLIHFDSTCVSSQYSRFELRVKEHTPHQLNTLDSPPALTMIQLISTKYAF